MEKMEKEYLRSCREKHNMTHNTKEMRIEVGDAVIIKSDEKSKGKWSIGIVEELYKDKDAVIRGVRLRTPKLYI